MILAGDHVSVDAQSRLAALRQRLRDTAEQLGPDGQRAPAGPVDPSAALLRDVDEILTHTTALTRSLARAEGPEWDECDELTGRLVLRDLSRATASLRRVLQSNGDELERTRSVLRRLDDAFTSIDEKVGEFVEYLQARHDERASGAPKKPRPR